MRHTIARLFVTAAAVISLAFADGAAADLTQLRPLDLRVADGEGSWHADNDFRLDWDRPPIAEGLPVAAVHYRVRDGVGNVVVEVRIPWDTTQIESVHVPPRPGRYTADVRLEGGGGELGPWVSATLLFDDGRPGAAQPFAPSGWIAGNAAATVRIEHPAGPAPVSGIRGYAVAVDRGVENPLCAGFNRCSLGETDLRGGIDADTISLGVLPEGASVVRVVAVSGAGMRSEQVRSAVVRVDASRPEVSLRGLLPGWASGPQRLIALATDELSGMTLDGPSGPYTSIAVDGGVPKAEPGDSVAATISGEGLHRVSAFARDAAGNSGDEATGVATVRIDEHAPVVTFSRAQDPADPERIEATVTDPLSGPDPGQGSIAVRPLGSRQRFEPLPTAASPGKLVARWDSDTVPIGTYEFRATGYDMAGNATTSALRGNGAKMVLVNPVKTPVEIEASFRQRRRARIAPYGRRVPFSGRLSAAGTRLAGLPIEIVETFDGGASPDRRTTTVETASDGSFLTRLAPGPSRQVEASFAGTRTLTRAGAGSARLGVLAAVRLRASAVSARIGGDPVVFSGGLGDLGAPGPGDGRPVELQFRLAGGRWSEFRTVQTDPRGRFRFPYSFSDDDSRGVRFQFRAFVPAQDGWPYEPAASRAVFVTGR
jgi:hypothetical protein